MLTIVLTVAATAILSSVTTLALASWFLRRRWEAEWRAALDARLDELGQTVRERVREGAREGVLDAVAALPSPETLRGTTESVVRTAGTLMGTLLGGARRDDAGS